MKKIVFTLMILTAHVSLVHGADATTSSGLGGQEGKRDSQKTPEGVKDFRESQEDPMSHGEQVSSGEDSEDSRLPGEDVRPKDGDKKKEEAGGVWQASVRDLGATEGEGGEEAFLGSIDQLSESFKEYMHRADVHEFQNQLADAVRNYIENSNASEAARTFALNLPETSLFGNLFGLAPGSVANTIAFSLFIGWPLLLGLVYVALIVAYPNRRSESKFEKNLSHMVMKMSHMMHAAENNLFDFLEDITDPGDSSAHQQYLVPSHQYLADERQEVFFKPYAYYDDDGQLVGEDFVDYEETPQFDAWGNPVQETTFVAPNSGHLNPVVSFNPPSSAPLREQIDVTDVSQLSQVAQAPNEIFNKDKHNFLSVVLGTQYQHSLPPGSPADEGIITGSISSGVDNRPQPPRNYQPEPPRPITHPVNDHQGFRFEADVDPRLRNKSTSTSPPTPGVRFSEFHSPRDDGWIPGNKPFRRRLGVEGGDGEEDAGSRMDAPMRNTFLEPDYYDSQEREYVLRRANHKMSEEQ